MSNTEQQKTSKRARVKVLLRTGSSAYEKRFKKYVKVPANHPRLVMG